MKNRKIPMRSCVVTREKLPKVELLRIAGNVVYKTHQYLKPYIKEGITTKEIDKLAEDFIRSRAPRTFSNIFILFKDIFVLLLN